MIRTVQGELIAECTECGATSYGGTLEWTDFIEELKEDGWRIRKIDGEWFHYCEDCPAPPWNPLQGRAKN
jgi:hypothetical protein